MGVSSPQGNETRRGATAKCRRELTRDSERGTESSKEGCVAHKAVGRQKDASNHIEEIKEQVAGIPGMIKELKPGPVQAKQTYADALKANWAAGAREKEMPVPARRSRGGRSSNGGRGYQAETEIRSRKR